MTALADIAVKGTEALKRAAGAGGRPGRASTPPERTTMPDTLATFESNSIPSNHAAVAVNGHRANRKASNAKRPRDAGVQSALTESAAKSTAPAEQSVYSAISRQVFELEDEIYWSKIGFDLLHATLDQMSDLSLPGDGPAFVQRLNYVGCDLECRLKKIEASYEQITSVNELLRPAGGGRPSMVLSRVSTWIRLITCRSIGWRPKLRSTPRRKPILSGASMARSPRQSGQGKRWGPPQKHWSSTGPHPRSASYASSSSSRTSSV